MTARGRRHTEFEAFVATSEPKLRRALVARYGAARGRDVTAEALAYAWAHWRRVSAMQNPVGYLFRVGQSKSRARRAGWSTAWTVTEEPWVEPALVPALGELSEQQRVAVVLVHGFGWTAAEVAELLDVKASTVQTHVERARAAARPAGGARP